MYGGGRYRMPFREVWESLPPSVQNRVRIAIMMVGVWCFIAGFVLGVMV